MCLTIGATEVVWILVRKRNDGRISQNFFSQALLNLRDEVIDNPDFATITADDPNVIDSIGLKEPSSHREIGKNLITIGMIFN